MGLNWGRTIVILHVEGDSHRLLHRQTESIEVCTKMSLFPENYRAGYLIRLDLPEWEVTPTDHVNTWSLH
jgi:hypothetical protein